MRGRRPRRAARSSSAPNTRDDGLCGLLKTTSLVRRRERLGQRLLGDPPVGRSQPDEARHPAGAKHQRQIGVVERLEEQHLVARLDQRHQRRGQRLGRAGGDDRPPRARPRAPGAPDNDRRPPGAARAGPRIGGYWLEPRISASAARATTSSGQPKSGKPWPRLTAPCSRASADMRVEDRGRHVRRRAGSWGRSNPPHRRWGGGPCEVWWRGSSCARLAARSPLHHASGGPPPHAAHGEDQSRPISASAAAGLRAFAPEMKKTYVSRGRGGGGSAA